MDVFFLVSLCSALIALAAAAYSGRSWPIKVRQRLQAAEDEIAACTAAVARQSAAWDEKLVELARFEESLHALLEDLERKRRQLASRQAAEKRHNGAAQEPADRHGELLRLARAQGHQV